MAYVGSEAWTSARGLKPGLTLAVVVAVADLDRFVVICRGRMGERGGERGAEDMVAAASSRLFYGLAE